MAIHDEKYVSFTTLKKDGSPKAVPVWIADLGDGTSGFTTPGQSWKAKRLRNNPKVMLQPCNGQGKIKDGTFPIEGTARLATDSETLERVRVAIKTKYGFSVKLIKAVMKVQGLFGKAGESDTAVLVELNQ